MRESYCKFYDGIYDKSRMDKDWPEDWSRLPITKLPMMSKKENTVEQLAADITQERLLKLAEQLQKDSALKADEIAVELADRRIARMSDEDLDVAKKRVIEKREADLDTRDKAIKSREVKAAKVERDLDARTAHLEEELVGLKRDIKEANEDLESTRAEYDSIRSLMNQEKIAHEGMIQALKNALARCQALEDRYGAFEEKAEAFVDDRLLDYFDLEGSEDEA